MLSDRPVSDLEAALDARLPACRSRRRAGRASARRAGAGRRRVRARTATHGARPRDPREREPKPCRLRARSGGGAGERRAAGSGRGSVLQPRRSISRWCSSTSATIRARFPTSFEARTATRRRARRRRRSAVRACRGPGPVAPRRIRPRARVVPARAGAAARRRRRRRRRDDAEQPRRRSPSHRAGAGYRTSARHVASSSARSITSTRRANSRRNSVTITWSCSPRSTLPARSAASVATARRSTASWRSLRPRARLAIATTSR